MRPRASHATEPLLLIVVACWCFAAANGFSMAGSARARDGKLEQMEEEGVGGAKLAVFQLEHIDEYLSACQLGITMASLGIGFMGEPAIASLLESAIGDSVPHGVTLAVSLAFAYLITTALHITVGEQVPKTTPSRTRRARPATWPGCWKRSASPSSR